MDLKLYKLIDNIQKELDDNFYNDNKNEIISEINEILTTDNFNKLLEVIIEDKFYLVLTDLYITLSSENFSKIFLARLWYKKLISMPKEKQTNFLDFILMPEVDTFTIFEFYKEFLSNEINLSADFIIDWFVKLGKFVHNDYCAFLFYDGLIPFSKNNINLSFNILKKLLELEYSSIIHNLISNILGTLRTLNFQEIDNLDIMLKNSESLNKQKYYYSSLVITYNEIGVEEDELNQIFNEIINKKVKEIEDQAFYIAYSVFLSSKKEELQKFVLQWIIINSNQNLSDLSKYYCVKLSQQIISKNKNIDCLSKILTNIQPINNEDKGTYKSLSFTLYSILEKYPEKFNELFRNILKINNFKVLLNEEYFIKKFVNNTDKVFFTELFISKNLNERTFAQEIYIKNSDKINLNENIILTINDKLFELIFKETLLKIHYGNIFAQFIINLNSRLEKVEDMEFKNFLDVEITHQCLNFPEGCFQILESSKDKCELVKICVQKAKNYFDIILKYKDSPVNSFSFPSCNDAAIKGLIKQNKEIKEQTEKQSVLKSFCSSVELLYGSMHAHRTSEGITESTPFTKLEHSIELPFLSSINPISEVFKRHSLSVDITEIRKEIINAE